MLPDPEDAEPAEDFAAAAFATPDFVGALTEEGAVCVPETAAGAVLAESDLALALLGVAEGRFLSLLLLLALDTVEAFVRERQKTQKR